MTRTFKTMLQAAAAAAQVKASPKEDSQAEMQEGSKQDRHREERDRRQRQLVLHQQRRATARSYAEPSTHGRDAAASHAHKRHSTNVQSSRGPMAQYATPRVMEQASTGGEKPASPLQTGKEWARLRQVTPKVTQEITHPQPQTPPHLRREE